jgi:hypothetical protein
VIPYRATLRYEEQPCTVDIPNLTVPRCGACGEMLFDNAANDQISDAFRAHLRLLAPEQIRRNRTALKLSPEELSGQLGMPPGTVGELEDRLRLQSRALDNLLRVFFAIPQVRAALGAAERSPDFGLEVWVGP